MKNATFKIITIVLSIFSHPAAANDGSASGQLNIESPTIYLGNGETQNWAEILENWRTNNQPNAALISDNLDFTIVQDPAEVNIRTLERGALISSAELLSMQGFTALDQPVISLSPELFTKPTAPIDAFKLFDQDNNLLGIVTTPPNTSTEDFYLDSIREGKFVSPTIVEFGEKAVSSLNHIILVTLDEVCQSSFRPEEISLTITGGVALFAKFEGSITAKIDLNTSCTTLKEKIELAQSG